MLPEQQGLGGAGAMWWAPGSPASLKASHRQKGCRAPSAATPWSPQPGTSQPAMPYMLTLLYYGQAVAQA